MELLLEAVLAECAALLPHGEDLHAGPDPGCLENLPRDMARRTSAPLQRGSTLPRPRPAPTRNATKTAGTRSRLCQRRRVLLCTTMSPVRSRASAPLSSASTS